MKNPNSKIALVCCSNGLKRANEEKIKQLEITLSGLGLQPVFSDYIYEKEDSFSGTAKEWLSEAGRNRIYAGFNG